MSRFHNLKVLFVAVALVTCASMLQGATLVATPSAITLPCDTVLGPTPVTVGITLFAAGAQVTTVTATNGTAQGATVLLPSPANPNVPSTTVPTRYTFSAKVGCTGTIAGTVNLVFTPAVGTPITVIATLTAPTNSGSPLAISPSAVTIACTRAAGADTVVGAPKTISVTSPAYLGTNFTIDNATYAPPAWLTLSNGASAAQSAIIAGGNASATPFSFTVTPTAGCGNLPVGSTTFNLHLITAAPVTAVTGDKILAVTIQVGTAASTLAAATSPVALSYTKGIATYTPVTSSITTTTAPSQVFVTVDPSSLPLWLNVTPTTNITPVTLSFAPTPGADVLAPGLYTANVRLKVSGALDFVLPVTLKVLNTAAVLSVSEGTVRSANWTLNAALPTFLITPISSDAPIAYAVTTSGLLSPQVSSASGLASYNFGSPIVVTFPQAVFSAALPGTDIAGHVILTPTTGTAVDVLLTVHIKAAGPAIGSLSPSSLSTTTSGSFTVNVVGSGFVSSADPNIRTKVGVVVSGAIVSDFNISAAIQNSTLIVLTINVPSSLDTNLPFGAGGPVVIGVCNPQISCATIPAGQQSILTISVGPIVQAVTSASSYIQATMPVLTSVAPYDILSVFGTAFCMSGGTGCTGANPILYGTTDAINPAALRYVTTLSPDATGPTQRNLTVSFQVHGTSTVIGVAPILFATNNQINVIVPDAVKAYVGNTVDVVVSFGYLTGATLLKSAPYAVTVAATNPGVFTVGGSGQGDAAALMPVTYALVTPTNPAGIRKVAVSDSIAFYVTGLGVPDSDGTGGTAWAGLSPCMTLDSFWALVNSGPAPTPAVTSNDGLVIQSALFPASTLQPCMLAADPITVTIGGQAGTVVYAGWVADSVAGLYQINVTLPANTAALVDASNVTAAVVATAKSLPVVFTSGGRNSQATGVNLSVVRRPLLTLPTYLSGARTVLWPVAATSNVVATDDTGSAFTYAFTGAVAGLVFGSDGTITGTPTAVAGTYPISVVVTETGGLATTVSGSFIITLTP